MNVMNLSPRFSAQLCSVSFGFAALWRERPGRCDGSVELNKRVGAESVRGILETKRKFGTV